MEFGVWTLKFRVCGVKGKSGTPYRSIYELSTYFSFLPAHLPLSSMVAAIYVFDGPPCGLVDDRQRYCTPYSVEWRWYE